MAPSRAQENPYFEGEDGGFLGAHWNSFPASLAPASIGVLLGEIDGPCS